MNFDMNLDLQKTNDENISSSSVVLPALEIRFSKTASTTLSDQQKRKWKHRLRQLWYLLPSTFLSLSSEDQDLQLAQWEKMLSSSSSQITFQLHLLSSPACLSSQHNENGNDKCIIEMDCYVKTIEKEKEKDMTMNNMNQKRQELRTKLYHMKQKRASSFTSSSSLPNTTDPSQTNLKKAWKMYHTLLSQQPSLKSVIPTPTNVQSQKDTYLPFLRPTSTPLAPMLQGLQEYIRLCLE